MSKGSDNKDTGMLKELRCSFCEKDASECNYLIEGPQVYICDRCVDVCVYVLKNKKSEATVMTPLNHKEANPYESDS